MPEDRGGSIQERVTLVFKTFDLGASTHTLNLVPFFFFNKKSLIRLLRNSLSKNIVLMFPVHEAKGTSSLQMKPISTCR